MNTPRSTKPEKGNKYYIRRATGGYSGCIQGNPKDPISDVLANCVGFANGFLNELEDKGKEIVPLTCNAENFIERAISYGYSIVKEPVVGGIMVWQKGATLSGSDGAGHVAGVYAKPSAAQVKTAESGYGNKAFWTATRNKGNGNWGAGTGYTYRGCIVPKYWKEPVKPEPKPEPEPIKLKYKVGDVVLFSGALYADSYGNKKGQTRKDLKAVISIVNNKGNKPYNINNGLGWVAEKDLLPYIEPIKPKPIESEFKFKVGQRVKIDIKSSGYSASADGKGRHKAANGWVREVIKIHKGKPYPYQIGLATITTGFFKEEDLKNI